MKKLQGGKRLLAVLALSSLASITLYLISTVRYNTYVFWFLNWNLLLAWLPLLLAIWLVEYLKNNPWFSWPGVFLALFWLGFLPNSFYIISDLMHLNVISTANPLYYAVMMFSFSFNGLMLGFVGIYLIHRELLKRFKPTASHCWIAAILLLCSFAMYLGRYLRWNTWDVVLNPAGVVFDVSDRIVNPVAYGQTFQVTALFFVLLGSMYFVLWNMARAIDPSKSS